MKNILEVLLYALIEIIDFILAYIIIFDAKITKKRCRLVVGCALIIGFHLGIYLLFAWEQVYDMAILVLLIVPGMLLSERKREYYILYLFIYSLGNIFSVASAFARSIALAKPFEEILTSGREQLVCQLIQTAVMFVLFLCTRISKNKGGSVNFSVSHYIVFNMVALVSCIGIGTIEEMCINGIYDKKATIGGLVSSVADIIMMVAVVLTGITQQRRLEAENRIYYSEQIAMMQKDHYERMIVKDDQLRKFRHDLKGHIAVIKSYILGHDYESVLKYMDQIEETTNISGQVNMTGNGIIDAIIESFCKEFESNNIRVSVEGLYGPNSSDIDMEMGVIVYNLLKNAVEACGSIIDENKRYIDIKASTYNDKKMLKITNSSAGKYRMHEGRLMTTKKDEYYHGYGMQNIQKAVNKCCGEIEYRIGDDIFEVIVII